jgi:chromosome partitioning protein
MKYGILMHEADDDVGVAVMDLTAGSEIGAATLEGQSVGSIVVTQDIPLGHKVAMRDMALPDIELMREGQREESDWLVIDSPAGLHGKNLERALKLAHKVVVPIAPSLFDIRASEDFLAALHAEKAVRKGHAFVAVVGMRVDPRTRAGVTLEQYMASLDLPVLAYLRNTQHYVNAAFEGKSLFDLPHHIAERDIEQWQGLIDWLET